MTHVRATAIRAAMAAAAGLAVAGSSVVWAPAADAVGPVTVTFSTPGGSSWTVPAGVTSVTVSLAGGQGGDAIQNPSLPVVPGGLGAQVGASIAVSPDDVLDLVVAGAGHNNNRPNAGAGGAGGGGNGAAEAGGGGGASRISVGTTVLAVAAGGGGAATYAGNGAASAGAGRSSGSATGGIGGGPGTQTGGGAGGAGASGASFFNCPDNTSGDSGSDGQAGLGGNGGFDPVLGGGGGGGGYFGGGGGGGGAVCNTRHSVGSGGGGGGGSSYVSPAATDTTVSDGLRSGSGLITITYTDTAPPTADPTQTPAANAAGWNNSDVTVDWNWTDDGSGVDPANCTQQSTSSGAGPIELVASCTDLAGNTATATYTVKVDKTQPTANPTQAPAANAAGWNNSDVTVDWNWTDDGSGVDPANCTQQSTSSGAGPIELVASCTDLAGNTATATYTVKVDKTQPTANPTQAPAANAAGWNNSDVTVDWNWTDDGSGVDPANCTQQSTSSGAGPIELVASCTDLAGNTATATYTVKVDKTQPTANPTQAPAANAAGWNNSDVTVDWNWTDDGSGVDPANCTQQSTSSGAGPIELIASCTDLAGNTATATYTVKVDKTPPTVTITVPTDGATYPVGRHVAVDYSCADAVSGIDTCTGPVADGAVLDTSKPGAVTFTVIATDLAGRQATATITYTVVAPSMTSSPPPTTSSSPPPTSSPSAAPPTSPRSHEPTLAATGAGTVTPLTIAGAGLIALGLVLLLTGRVPHPNRSRRH